MDKGIASQYQKTGGGNNEQFKLITHSMEMPVSYCFIPKYRRKTLMGQIKADIREIIKKLCEYRNIEIVAGAVYSDHVHICVSIPPKQSVSEFVGYLKGKSALMIFDKHPELTTKWTKSFWARGYYVSTVGNVTEDAIKNIYLRSKKRQRRKRQEDSFFQRQDGNNACDTRLLGAQVNSPYRATIKPPVELVVGDLAVKCYNFCRSRSEHEVNYSNCPNFTATRIK